MKKFSFFAALFAAAVVAIPAYAVPIDQVHCKLYREETHDYTKYGGNNIPKYLADRIKQCDIFEQQQKKGGPARTNGPRDNGWGKVFGTMFAVPR